MKKKFLILALIMLLLPINGVAAKEVTKCSFLFFGCRTYTDPETFKNQQAESQNPYVTDDGDCESNYGGIRIKDGKMEVVKPCKVESTFDGTAEKSAETMRGLITFFRGVSVIIGVISLVWGDIQLAMSAGNARNKEKAWGRIKISLIVVALLGGLNIIITWVFNIL